MLQEFLQRLMGGSAPVQPVQNRLGLAPDMLEGPGAAGPGILAHHNALSSMSAPQPAQQAQPFALDAQGFPPAPAPYAPPQATQQPQQSQAPLSRSGVSDATPQGSGGGIGGFLGNIFNPGGAGRNQTVQWLQSQGMDEGMATLMAGNKGALQNYLLDRTKGADPKAALELAKLQLEVGNLANPQLSPAEAARLELDRQKFGFDQQQAGATTNIKDYQFYEQREREAGREPLGPLEWEKAQRASGAMTVDARNVGTVPQGYRMIYDANNNPVELQRIPGGPADTSQTDAASAESRETSTGIITTAAQRAREALNAGGLPSTGTVGRIMSNLPESNASEVRRQVGVLQANAKIENLQAMRAASPTGGALGAVSDSESAMLAAKSGALDPDSPTFARDLDDYERTLLRIVHGPRVGDAIFEQSRSGNNGAPQPVNIDGYTIEQVD